MEGVVKKLPRGGISLALALAIPEPADSAVWLSVSYCPDPIAEIEPIDDDASPYREAALDHLHVLFGDRRIRNDDERSAFGLGDQS